jgi:transmembrane sensor
MSLDQSGHLLQSLLGNPAFRCWAEGKCPEDGADWSKWAAEHENGQDILRQAIEIARAVPVRDGHLTDEYIHHKVHEALQAAKKTRATGSTGKKGIVFSRVRVRMERRGEPADRRWALLCDIPHL